MGWQINTRTPEWAPIGRETGYNLQGPPTVEEIRAIDLIVVPNKHFQGHTL